MQMSDVIIVAALHESRCVMFQALQKYMQYNNLSRHNTKVAKFPLHNAMIVYPFLPFHASFVINYKIWTDNIHALITPTLKKKLHE